MEMEANSWIEGEEENEWKIERLKKKQRGFWNLRGGKWIRGSRNVALLSGSVDTKSESANDMWRWLLSPERIAMDIIFRFHRG